MHLGSVSNKMVRTASCMFVWLIIVGLWHSVGNVDALEGKYKGVGKRVGSDMFHCESRMPVIWGKNVKFWGGTYMKEEQAALVCDVIFYYTNQKRNLLHSDFTIEAFCKPRASFEILTELADVKKFLRDQVTTLMRALYIPPIPSPEERDAPNAAGIHQTHVGTVTQDSDVGEHTLLVGNGGFISADRSDDHRIDDSFRPDRRSVEAAGIIADHFRASFGTARGQLHAENFLIFLEKYVAREPVARGEGLTQSINGQQLREALQYAQKPPQQQRVQEIHPYGADEDLTPDASTLDLPAESIADGYDDLPRALLYFKQKVLRLVASLQAKQSLWFDFVNGLSAVLLAFDILSSNGDTSNTRRSSEEEHQRLRGPASKKQKVNNYSIHKVTEPDIYGESRAQNPEDVEVVFWHKLYILQDLYLKDMVGLSEKLTTGIRHQLVPAQRIPKVQSDKDALNRMILFLRKPENRTSRDNYKLEEVDAFEKKIVTILEMYADGNWGGMEMNADGSCAGEGELKFHGQSVALSPEDAERKVVWRKLQELSKLYLEDMIELYSLLTARSNQPMPAEQLQKLKHYKDVLHRMIPYLRAPEDRIPCAFGMEKVDCFEKQVVIIMDTFLRKRT